MEPYVKTRKSLDRLGVRGRPRIILADDHTLVRSGFEKILERDYDVVATVGDGRELVHAVVVLRPDVAIVDIGLPVMNGIEAAREIVKEKISTRIVFLSMHTSKEYALEAMQAGGHAYVLKHSQPQELQTAIREVLFGRIYVSPMVADGVMDRLRRREDSRDVLTPRQLQILRMVADGFSSRRIAATLKVSVKTVDFHRANIMQRLDLHTVADLTRYVLTEPAALNPPAERAAQAL